MTERSLRRRLARLVAAHAVWYLPVYDFRKTTGVHFVRFLVGLDPASRAVPNPAALARAVGDAVFVQLGPTMGAGPAFADVGTCIRSVAEVDQIGLSLLSVPGAVGVEPLFPGQFHFYPAWFDEHLA